MATKAELIKQLEHHRAVASMLLTVASAYKRTGNQQRYADKMFEYEREMREVVKLQISLKKEGHK